MKNIVRLIAAIMLLSLLGASALADATPTPPPVQIDSTQVEPPTIIQEMLEIAYNEWLTLNGEKLPNVNKFTEWRGKGYEFEWCAGYVTWVMMEAGIPMQDLQGIKDSATEYDDGLFHVDGPYHCMEASPGKLLRAYQLMERATMIPQKGFIIIYGCSYNKVIHAAIVYDVEDLGDGKYRLTTLEGNIGDSIKMYIRDYDMNATVDTNNQKSTNLSEVPESERVIAESATVSYEVMTGKPSSSANGKYTYYVNRFLMPWVPGDPDSGAEEAAEETPAPTPAPSEEPVVAELVALTPPAETAVPEAAAAPTATPAPEVTEAPTTTPVPEATEAPAATSAPENTEAAEDITAATPTEATAAPTSVPAPTYPCQGKDGTCIYITRDPEDAFCRACDRNDNGVEDSQE